MNFGFQPNMNMNMPPIQQPFNVFNKIPMAPPLYIGDLDENIHDETLHDFFSKFGPIHFVRIMRDPATGKSRGFGFVNFIYPRDAESARQYAQYEKLGRKYIRIMFKRNIRDLVPEANVYVKNIDPSVTVKDLHNLFTQVGPVLCAKVATNSEGQSLGYGYVQFEKKEDADNSVNVLQGTRLKETELQLFSFVPKDRRGATTAKRNIYVKHLPLGKSENEIDTIVNDVFSKYGEVETKLVKRQVTEGKEKYSAFVCFKTEEGAQKAVSDITNNPRTLEGAEDNLYANWHQGRAERTKELKRLYSQANNDTNLYIKNLRQDVTEAEVKNAFQQFGKITSIAVKDWNSNTAQRQARFGFVAFDNADDAKRAQAEGLGNAEIRGLYTEGAEPYIGVHQPREKRNEYLYAKRRRRMQTGMMNMDAMRGMQFAPFANRRFQPFPPMMGQMFRPASKGPRQYVNKQGYTPKPHYGGNRNQGPRQPNRGPYQPKKNDRPAVPNKQPAQPAASEGINITVQNLRNKLAEFLQLDIEKQRQILGELLFPLIRDRSGENFAPKITGMLIDLSVLEVSEILEFLENPQLLDERVSEAQALIVEEGI